MRIHKGMYLWYIPLFNISFYRFERERKQQNK
jgi:hypothetical protein